VATVQAQTPGSSTPRHRLRTYIVEDSAVIRENLIATLEELGPLQVVGTAEDETTAVEWLEHSAGQIDLVIVDIFLGRGSGLAVLRAARQRPDRGRKIVVLSNYATPDMRNRCLALGADQVFDKSHDLESLLQYCTRLADDASALDGSSGQGALN
jgi:CheY-like chemotaxis protein